MEEESDLNISRLLKDWPYTARVQKGLGAAHTLSGGRLRAAEPEASGDAGPREPGREPTDRPVAVSARSARSTSDAGRIRGRGSVGHPSSASPQVSRFASRPRRHASFTVRAKAP